MTATNPQASEEKVLTAENEAVIKHMEMYQGIITRMAGNSAACKTWGIPLVAAILGFVIEKQNASLGILAILTILVLYLLDSYYLKLEINFREGFNNSAAKIQGGIFKQSDLYQLLPSDIKEKHWMKAVKSPATWPVYLGLFILVLFSFYAVA